MSYIPQNGDRVRLTREIVVVDARPDHRGRILAEIPDAHDRHVLVPLAGATFEKIEPPKPSLRDQYEALEPGTMFIIPGAYWGDERRIKLSNEKYFNVMQDSVIQISGLSDVGNYRNQHLSLQVVDK